MGLGKTLDLTQRYKQGVYNIQLEVSNWDTVTFQVVAPVAGTLSIYGTLNDGMSQGSLYPDGNYGADRALDWSAVQAVNLATGSAVSTISAAGIYSVPVNTPYLRLGGGGDLYGLFQFNSKIG
jgi:hypothetical protein